MCAHVADIHVAMIHRVMHSDIADVRPQSGSDHLQGAAAQVPVEGHKRQHGSVWLALILQAASGANETNGERCILQRAAQLTGIEHRGVSCLELWVRVISERSIQYEM